MKEDNDLYNVLKMQRDYAERLVTEEEAIIQRAGSNNEEYKQFNDSADAKLEENKAWLESLGISLDTIIPEAHRKAADDAQKLLDEVEKANETYESNAISYEDLVYLAHTRGYNDTTIQDLLTEDEIQIADQRFTDIENEFCARTRLKRIDVVFLVTAIALQVVRQYAITPFSDRGTADEKAKVMEKKYGKDGKLRGKYYYATEETIIDQKKVPFDIIAGSKKYGIGKDGKGLDGNSHRFRSLGHDPILGYVFGTANIVTNTATWWNGTSHHIQYKPNAIGVFVPTLAANANTGKVFESVVDRFKGDGGKKILVEAIVKEHLHLKSDISTDGLPIPFLQAISPDFAQILAEHGLDAIVLGDIAKQAAGAEFINFIISTVHSLICAENGELDRKLYQVRTRKIILISNIVASASNLIAVGIATGLGVAGENPEAVKKSLKYLDVGGLLVTITHLFTDLRFISKVKEEFIQSKLDAQLLDELNKLDKYLES
jgi:hypothetical protein